MTDENIRYFEDLCFAVVATEHSASVEFKIFDVISWSEDGPIYQRKGSDRTDPISELENAEVFADGFVKWDGCSNWLFNQGEDSQSMIHGCTRGDIARIGAVLSACWDWAKELLDSFEGCE